MGANDNELPPDPSVTRQERVSVRLGGWRPPEQYNQPQLEPDAGTRTKEHKVVGDVSVVQGLGENASAFTLRGDAFEVDIGDLKTLRNEVIELRHPIHSGEVLVTNVSATATSSWDVVEGQRKWIYTYTVEMREIF